MAEVTMQSINYLFGKSFFVPTYQRGYRWTETQVKELLEDLYDFVSTKKDENDYYCLQPIIVKKKEDCWELVDGQQRLTALWLISMEIPTAFLPLLRVQERLYSSLV